MKRIAVALILGKLPNQKTFYKQKSLLNYQKGFFIQLFRNRTLNIKSLIL